MLGSTNAICISNSYNDKQRCAIDNARRSEALRSNRRLTCKAVVHACCKQLMGVLRVALQAPHASPCAHLHSVPANDAISMACNQDRGHQHGMQSRQRASAWHAIQTKGISMAHQAHQQLNYAPQKAGIETSMPCCFNDPQQAKLSWIWPFSSFALGAPQCTGYSSHLCTAACSAVAYPEMAQ